IPRTIEKDDLPRRRQMLDVALEIPLPPLALGRHRKRDDPRGTGIQVFHETLYGTTFSCRVTALKDHYDTAARVLDPVLQLQQLYLEAALRVIACIAAQPHGGGRSSAPGAHQGPVGVAEHRVVLVDIVHPHARRDHVVVIRPVRAGVIRVSLPPLSHIQPHPAPAPAPPGISPGQPRRYHGPRQGSSGIHCLGALMHPPIRAARPAISPGASALFAYASNHTVIRIRWERIGNLRSRDAWNRRRGRRLGPFPPRPYLGDASSRAAAGLANSLGGPPGPGSPGHRCLLGSARLPRGHA